MCNFSTQPSLETRCAEGCALDIMSTSSAYPLMTLGTLSHGIGLRMSETLHLVYTPSVLSSSFDEDCYQNNNIKIPMIYKKYLSLQENVSVGLTLLEKVTLRDPFTLLQSEDY